MSFLGALVAGIALWVPVTGPSPFPASCAAAGAQRASEVEPSIAAAPSGGLAVAAWQQDRYVERAAVGIGVGVSRDGGLSWSPVDVPGMTECTPSRRFASDPWVSVGAGGVLWLATLQVESTEEPLRSRVAVASSSDGGASWSSPSFLDAGGAGFNDKPSLTADPLRPGVAYAVWTLEGAPFFARTVDGGRTWSPPSRIGDPATVSSTVSVLPRGGLLHVYLAYGRGRLRIESTRSANGGLSWSSPETVARIPRPAGDVLRTGRPPVRALPFSGSGPAVTPAGAAFEAFVSGAGIALVGSSDGGRRWSRPRLAVRHRLGVFGPTLAAARDELGLSYYARETGGRASFWIARSSDGRRWTSRRLTAPFPLRRAPRAGDAVFLGDYTGLTAAPGGGFLAAFSAPPPIASAGRADVLVSRP